ncbi:MAG: divalent-cation tolerance protein CutA [Thermodesulfobacterium geofontis]|uniref:Divalent-cation tolerance protein CutA n=1 Tax=Thermodesulfobacterium geofontis TaxID=1295609 RepID=A0A2N7PN61_9BACT|nr:MAG: divalent-cation tolerance protein CutA [Thermodesulfobacterium geofontis]
MKEKIVFLYVTCGSKEEAQKIGKTLLEERLCACINIYQEVKSMYWWKGKIEEAKEAILIVKTRESLADLVEQKILELHSYTCPCIARMKIEKTNECFSNWLFEETKGG